MSKRVRTLTLVSFAVLMHAPFICAQDAEPESAKAATDNSVEDREVEVTEDSYRQFMELKDPLKKREVLPETAYQPRSGLQKIDDLPESSQKHLREQLREIIVQRAPWKPGDENDDYPYVPSEAAGEDAELKQLEGEAWSELVGNYHDREATIHANTMNFGAPDTGTEGGPGTQGNASEGQEAGTAGTGANMGETSGSSQDSPGAKDGEDTFQPGKNSGAAQSNEVGVTQSAMRFLSGAGGKSPVQNDQNGAAQQTTGQAALSAKPSSETQAGSTQNAMQALEQNAGANGQASDSNDEVTQEAVREPGSNTSPAETTPAGQIIVSASESEADDTDEGVSQNALQYLSGDDDKTGDDTLAIEDLINARGVSGNAQGQDQRSEPENPPRKKDDGYPPGGGI
jgi:hypothetical protein